MKVKANTSKQYGSADVFKFEEIELPILKPNELLIRNYATTVTGSDIMMREGKPYIGRLYLGLFKPKNDVLGFDFAGEIASIGDAVKQFKVGQRVFGGTTKLGCYAEYLIVHSDDVVLPIPDNIGFNEAAPLSGSAITVMNFLVGMAKIQPGMKVLINGASGGLGTYAIQIAKYYKTEVTGICSEDNAQMVKSLGADTTIDYRANGFLNQLELYDIIFDTVGKLPFKVSKHYLTTGGQYLSSVASLGLFKDVVFSKLKGNKKVKTGATGMLPAQKRLEYLKAIVRMVENNQVTTKIDRIYPLESLAIASKYVELGHKKGHVVITI